ncbi:carbohydrate binding domain-containing protein [Paenibacillus mucilaginosus]|uniref:BglA2 n=1 Tax=Paenibacillus mucilaginosus (strain KNP414) TaxID=1036673 RepID=F8F6C8_PAEMK|nr:carbohydrate binding domain-containing protein [Paenibacillus mucilaginosus]AEI42402.1 BglA2 [Paenibacillus mucilaginosus KNP414]
MKMRKALVIGLSVLTLWGQAAGGILANPPVPGSHEAELLDLSQHWSAAEVVKWVDAKVLEGYPDGTFRPDAPITRAEFVSVLQRLFGFRISASGGQAAFTDIEADAWYKETVTAALRQGYVSGYPDNTFRPNAPITREEAAVLAARMFRLEARHDGEGTMLPYPDADRISGFARNAAEAMLAEGSITGYPDGTFRPQEPITRAETVSLLKRLTGEVFHKQGTYGKAESMPNAIVNAPGIKLSDAAIAGRLYLTEGLGGGDVVLERVQVKGVTHIGGGGSVQLTDSTFGTVVIKKQEQEIRVTAAGTTTVERLEVRSEALVEAVSSGMKDVLIHTEGPNDTVTLSGSFGRVEVASADSHVVVTAGSTIGELHILEGAKGTKVESAGALRSLLVDADGVSLNGKMIAKGASWKDVKPQGGNNSPGSGGSDPGDGDDGSGGGSEPGEGDDDSGGGSDPGDGDDDSGGGSDPGDGDDDSDQGLAYTVQAGKLHGTTRIDALAGEGRHLAVKVSHEVLPQPAAGDKAPADRTVHNPYVPGSDISGVDAVTNKYIGLYELDSNQRVMGYRLIELGADQIAAEAWKLRWADEFDQPGIDPAKWNFIEGGGGYGNNELQNYTNRPENARVEDGSLVIEAREESFGGSPYTSSKLTSQGKGEWTYGRYEIRAKLPAGQGIWPAIWMMPADETLYGPWPSSGEIDIMELLGHRPGQIFGTLHYGKPKEETQASYILPGNKGFDDDYHVFAIEWEPGEIRHYVDGILYSRMNDWFSHNSNEAAAYTYPAPFDRDFYMQLNLAVGGNWPGNPDATTTFPQRMLVDYVRVYELDGMYRSAGTRPKHEVVLREPAADGNYIINGRFENGLDAWQFQPFAPPADLFDGTGDVAVDQGAARITIGQEGSQTYAVQFVQPQIPLEKGASYRLTFDARSDGERTMVTGISGPERSYTRYLDDQSVVLNSELQRYTYDFEMKAETDGSARLEFNLGKAGTRPVWISNVKLTQTEAPDPNPVKEVLPDGNYIYNGTFDQGDDRKMFWDFLTVDGAEADFGVTNGRLGSHLVRELKVDVKKEGPHASSVAVSQNNLSLDKASAYSVMFSARAESPRSMEWNMKAVDPQNIVFLSERKLELTPEMKNFQVDFATADSDGPLNAKLELLLGNALGSVYLDNVRLVKRGAPTEVNGWTHMEADQYWGMQGIQVGADGTVGYLDTGDYFEFKLNVSQAGNYLVQSRLASDIGESFARLTWRDANRNVMGTQDYGIGRTGGWDTYRTMDLGQVHLTPGVYYLEISGDKFNTDWVELSPFLIDNGGFDEGLQGWDYFEADWLPGVSPSFAEAKDGKLQVSISDPGTEEWNIQVKQPGRSLLKGRSYTVSFDVYSTMERNILVVIQHDGTQDNVWTPYYENMIHLDGTQQHVEDAFIMQHDSDPSALFQFALGQTGAISVSHAVYIDNVVLKERAAIQPQGINLLPNSDFSQGTSGWASYSPEADQLMVSAAEEQLKIDIGTPGSNPWDRQVFLEGVAFQEGYNYTLTFKARTTKTPRKMNVSTGRLSGAPDYVWTGYHSEIIDLTAEAQTHTVNFDVRQPTNHSGRVSLELGNIDGGDSGGLSVYIDDIRLVNNGPSM